jgi:alpha-beta hydrolase superfamily lysophospholipase
MGGVISLNMILARPNAFKGAILSGTAIAVDPNVATPFRKWLASSDDPSLASLIKQKARLRPAQTCCPGHFLGPFKAVHRTSEMSCWDFIRLIRAGDAYADDPLIYHGGLRVNFGKQFMDVCAVENVHDLPDLRNSPGAAEQDKDPFVHFSWSR